MVEQQNDVVREIRQGVATVGFAGATVSAQVDEDEAEPLREIRYERHPVARVVRVSVDENDRRPLRVAHCDVGESLAVRELDGLLQRVEGVEVDFRGCWNGGRRDG